MILRHGRALVTRPSLALLLLLALTNLAAAGISHHFGPVATNLTDPVFCPFADVIVIGSEPEAIAAAVASAESGARTLLLSRDGSVGGLFVLGEMNVLDLRTQPHDYQAGFFERWWNQVGNGHSFDILRAETAFNQLLREGGVKVELGHAQLVPFMRDARVIGVETRWGP